GALGGECVVDREQDLAVPADGEALDRGDPDLLDAARFRVLVLQSKASIELVDEAEIADQVPEVADPALIQMREVDAGAEETPPGVLRVLDDTAAQDADLGLAVEQREIDRDLHCLDRRFVLGVEVARVAHRQDRRLALALEASSRELECAGAIEFGEPLRGSGMWKKHRMAKVRARGGVGQDLGEEGACRLLQTLLS